MTTPVATHGNLAADVSCAAVDEAGEWQGAGMVLLFPFLAFAVGSLVIDGVGVVDGRGSVGACFVDFAAVFALILVGAQLLRSIARGGQRAQRTAAL